jgi:hypothetical protein
MLSKFNIKLYLIVLGVDKQNGKRYVLSLDNNKIIPPTISLTKDILDNLQTNIVKYIQEFVFTNELELIPQLISLHSSNMETIDGELNTIYGFVIDKTDQINNSNWIEFSYTNPTEYSLVIFETIQNLK